MNASIHISPCMNTVRMQRNKRMTFKGSQLGKFFWGRRASKGI